MGQYRRSFDIPDSWKGKDVFLHIGSAISNVRVWINGKEVGYSEDSKLEACFDITKYIHTGKNSIALEIFRWCDATYLEDQDMWRLSGIARDVFLTAREKKRLEDVRISGSADGVASISVKVTKGVTSATYRITSPDGTAVASGTIPTKNGKASCRIEVPQPLLWSAETPWLYKLDMTVSDRKGTLESTSQVFLS